MAILDTDQKGRCCRAEAGDYDDVRRRTSDVDSFAVDSVLLQ